MGTQSFAQQRRSSRLDFRCRVKLIAFDDEGKQFNEETETVSISKFGASLKTKYQYRMGQDVTVLTLEHGHSGHFQVVWLSQPKPGEPGMIGVEWVNARRFWGLEFPPEDWGER